MCAVVVMVGWVRLVRGLLTLCGFESGGGRYLGFFVWSFRGLR